MQATAQNGPPGGPGGGGPGGPGGPVGGFHLIPPFAVEKMSLTEDQQKQIAELEKETKAKLYKILTAEQQKALEGARPPRPGQGGPGGQGSPADASGQRPPPPSPEGERPLPPSPQGGIEGGAGTGGPRPPASPIITALDLNNDGTIDADELAKASESLKKLDKNGDGRLTPDEYRPQRPGGPGGPGGPGTRREGSRPGGPGGAGPGGGQSSRPQRPASE